MKKFKVTYKVVGSLSVVEFKEIIEIDDDLYYKGVDAEIIISEKVRDLSPSFRFEIVNLRELN